MTSIVLLLYSLTSSRECRKSLFDHPLHCKVPFSFLFFKKGTYTSSSSSVYFQSPPKHVSELWAAVLLTSSDWSSIYQSSHWDTSQCQGVCGPFWVVLQNETLVQCAICLTSNKTCPSREPDPRLLRNHKCLISKKKRIKALFPPHFDQHLYPNGVSWGLFVFWECLGLMNSFEIISRAFKWNVCVSRALKSMCEFISDLYM